MGLFDRFLKRDDADKNTIIDLPHAAYIDGRFMERICSAGYRRLSDCPEVVAAVKAYADLISSMTIRLMANTDNGDVRIRNELSRKVDIEPYRYMTRATWMSTIIMNLLLYGNGNSIVLPHTRDGLLEDLEPIAPSRVIINDNPLKQGYTVWIDGVKFEPEEVLHFVENPDPARPYKGQGLKIALTDVINNIRQSRDTQRAFLDSKWKPSVIVKVDGLVDEFSTKDGRRKLLSDYIENDDTGAPWVIPADTIDVKEIRPLTLKDLAIDETVKLDKQTVAALLGVPNSLLGVGDFNANEWNNFINTKVKRLVRGIEQELTKKLLLSPRWYFALNYTSLLSYDLQTMYNIYGGAYVRGAATRNEFRERINLPPVENGDELVILENFVPADRIGDQAKLNGGNTDE